MNCNILSLCQTKARLNGKRNHGGRKYLDNLSITIVGVTNTRIRNFARLLCLASLSLFLSACISSSGRGVPSPEPVVVEDRAVVDGQPLPLPDQRPIVVEPLGGDAPMSPVVKRLAANASDQRRIGDWVGAASSLERALRIEPRNGRLWSRLAQVHHDQKSWKKAIQIAAKSNTLSGGNSNLLRKNWVLMADSYDALGDVDSADRYRAKLNQRNY